MTDGGHGRPAQAAPPGPHDPRPTSPPRLPGSVRRTSSIDSARPEGPGGPVVVDARARDLRTADDGSATGVEARLRFALDGAHRVTGVQTDPDVAEPDVAGVDQLVGATVGPGFRRLVAGVLPGERARRSLAHLLLDDLPGAVLVSGYALIRHQPVSLGGRGFSQVDLCAGWQSGGGMMRAIERDGVLPVPMGPPAPRLERDDDPLSWHDMAALPVHGMRRRRRLDLSPVGQGRYAFDVHFRDSHVDESGETVLHEYTVTGTVSAAERRILDADAVAQVLPWQECPGALASVAAVRGVALDDVDELVRRDLRGITTCTHLNDTLRSLADLGALLLRTEGDS